MQATIVALLSLHILFGQPPPIFSANDRLSREPPSIVHVWNQVGSRALLKVNWNWKPSLSKWHIQFFPGRHGYLGMTSVKECKIEIWIRTSQSPDNVAKTIVHELAHAFDHKYLDEKSRAAWIVARNLPASTLWYPSCNGCSDYKFGSGDFAECVSFTLQKPADAFRSKLGPPPNKNQQTLIKKWLNELPKR